MKRLVAIFAILLLQGSFWVSPVNAKSGSCCKTTVCHSESCCKTAPQSPSQVPLTSQQLNMAKHLTLAHSTMAVLKEPNTTKKSDLSFQDSIKLPKRSSYLLKRSFLI